MSKCNRCVFGKKVVGTKCDRCIDNPLLKSNFELLPREVYCTIYRDGRVGGTYDTFEEAERWKNDLEVSRIAKFKEITSE